MSPDKPVTQVPVTREELEELVEEAIIQAEEPHGPSDRVRLVVPAAADQLRRVAQTRDRVVAGTWNAVCNGSVCHCPVGAAGLAGSGLAPNVPYTFDDVVVRAFDPEGVLPRDEGTKPVIVLVVTDDNLKLPKEESHA